MPSIKKVLIANRGEIALRIIRTCKERGVKTVSVYSRPDALAPHVSAADESVFIGEAASSESYLVGQKIIDAAVQTGADAIHPGYGFLSENASFAKLCSDNNIIFIGPTPLSIEMMGDKTRARELMEEAGVPFPPGTKSAIQDIKTAKEIATEIGFPVLIKAAAGGGGKGMRIVDRVEDFEKSVKAAKSEAKNAFGDDRVFIEKYLEEPRHIEFQIVADQHGNTLHFFDRECSIQRRHQKVIEEAPSSVLSEELRSEMAEAAIKVARSCDYVGAGTIEFMIDKHMKFYFLEMNTRLQVEHPVTELITGFDLVALQLDVAEGKELTISQDDIQRNGHAIECRVYAEEPENQFLPSTGTLTRHREPSGPGVRIDSGVEEDQEISVHYDPMISKLCTHAPTRKQAIDKMLRALGEYEISGVKTTIPFCEFTLRHPSFRNGTYDTHFVKDHFETGNHLSDEELPIIALSSALLKTNSSNNHSDYQAETSGRVSSWWEKRNK